MDGHLSTLMLFKKSAIVLHLDIKDIYYKKNYNYFGHPNYNHFYY